MFLGEIEISELAMHADSKSVCCAGGFLGRGIIPNMNPFTVLITACAPFTVRPLSDVLETVFVVFSGGCVGKILNLITNTQIASTVIKTVTVTVIGEFTVLRVGDYAMHPNTLILACISVFFGGAAVSIPSMVFAHYSGCLPRGFHKKIVVGHINSCEQTSGQGYQSTFNPVDYDRFPVNSTRVARGVPLEESARFPFYCFILSRSIGGNRSFISASALAETVRNIHKENVTCLA